MGFALWGLYVLVWFLAFGAAVLGSVGSVLWLISRMFGSRRTRAERAQVEPLDRSAHPFEGKLDQLHSDVPE